MCWSQNLDSTRIQRAQRQQQQRLQQDVPVNIAFTYCGGFSPWITGMVVADDLFYRTTPLCCSLCASERKWCGSIFNYAGNYSCLLSNASETLALQSVSPPACSYCWVFPQWLSTLLSLSVSVKVTPADSKRQPAVLWWPHPMQPLLTLLPALCKDIQVNQVQNQPFKKPFVPDGSKKQYPSSPPQDCGYNIFCFSF